MSLVVDDVVNEALEADNLQLQNLSGQKYVQSNPLFLETVSRWQNNMGRVAAVLETWSNVQKKWQNLESIFIGSADIRVQLPEDSKRFDVVNADFQVGGGKGCERQDESREGDVAQERSCRACKAWGAPRAVPEARVT